MESATRTRSSSLATDAVTVLAVGLLIRRVVELVEIRCSNSWSSRRLARISVYGAANDSGKERGHRVVCVVPMYLEQAVAVDTVRFWHQLALRTDLDEVVFVTTAKEEPRDELSTHELIEAALAALREQPARLGLLKCRDVTRFRAAQLNIAVEHARRRFVVTGTDKIKIWIGVYNADSRPHASTFVELATRLSVEPDTRLYQQLADYVSHRVRERAWWPWATQSCKRGGRDRTTGRAIPVDAEGIRHGRPQHRILHSVTESS